MSRSLRTNPGGASKRPQRIDAYLNLHEAHLARFRDHFLIENDLDFGYRKREVRVGGRLHFVHDLILDVDIKLAVDADRRVRVIRYRFNAALLRDRHRPIFRYDNAHAYPGHPDAHHKHVFDPLDPAALGTVEWVGEELQPDLGAVIDELFAWWFEKGRFLGLGEG